MVVVLFDIVKIDVIIKYLCSNNNSNSTSNSSTDSRTELLINLHIFALASFQPSKERKKLA